MGRVKARSPLPRPALLPAHGALRTLLALLALASGVPAQGVLYGDACHDLLPAPSISYEGSTLPGEFGGISVAGAPPGALVVLHIGSSDSTSNFGPLPFSLDGIAGVAPGCALLGSGEIRLILNAKPDGTLKMGFKLKPALGSDLYFQWAVVESLSPLSISLTRGLHLSLATNPLMHVVILAPEIAVDHDGDGFATVLLDGADSHTHELGHLLAGHTWKEGATILGTDPVITADLALGSHEIALLIADDNQPAHTLMDTHVVQVVPVTAVPGVSARYHDSGAADPATLLDAVPPVADWTEILPTTFVGDGGGSVGGSPFSGQVLVRLQANVVLPVAGTWSFAANGGSARRLLLDGVPVTGPAVLSAGPHALDARFAVPSTAGLPLQVSAALGGGQPAPPEPAWLTHDQSVLAPVINQLTPDVGTTAGGNAIVLDGQGFFPKAGVIVHWGGQQLKLADGLDIAPERIAFASPPHAPGEVAVRVQTPAGESQTLGFTYSGSGPVPVNFERVTLHRLSQPTSGDWGPDGRLYIVSLTGELRAVTFDDAWNVVSVDTYPGVSQLANKDSLGLAFNPFDPPSPVRVYVSHGKLYADGGGAVPGPSTYHGAVSVLTGPAFDAPVPLVTGLSQSNSGHAVNGLQFDDNGDLLIAIGCNTNAGVKYITMGNLPEAPLSGAVLKARVSRPDFDGAVHYVEQAGGLPNDDQRFGEAVKVAPGSHVDVHASGLRNPYDLVYTTARGLYASDNGPNNTYGPASTGLATQTAADPEQPDELLLVEAGNYYGSANRSRGVDDPRQLVYRSPAVPSLPDSFTQAIATLPSSQDGIMEYRSGTFGGQMRGNLVLQKWTGGTTRVVLAPGGRKVTTVAPVLPVTWALDVVLGPGGAIVCLDQFWSELEVLAPVDSAATGAPEALDITPWRAPSTGGAPFVIGGRDFGTLANTSVSIGGVAAALDSVSGTRIRGTVPAHPGATHALVDVVVTSGPSSVVSTLPDAFRYLAPAPGAAPGFWRSGTAEGGVDLPYGLSGVAAGVLDGELVVVGAESSETLVLHLLDLDGSSAGATGPGAWHAHAPRPFVGRDHAAVVVAGKLLLIGGLGGGSEGRVQVYDPDDESWSLGADMPWQGGAVAAARLGGQVFAAGGLVGGVAVSNAARYDPVANTWTALPPLPAARHHASAGSDGARWFVFGGRSGGDVLDAGHDDSQVFDPVAGTWDWDKLPGSPLAPLPQARAGAGPAVWWGQELYVFGGLTESAPATPLVLGRVDTYDPALGTWRTDAPLPTPRHAIAPVLFQGRSFVVGGHPDGAGAAASTAFEVFTRQ
jgi:N-acetylneuraminic acid mutarotase